MTTVVTIGQAEIEAGLKWEREGSGRRTLNCPVAKAIGKAIGTPVSATDSSWGRVNDDGDRIGACHQMPEPVGEWIRRFDRREHVVPITFEVDDAE